MNKFCTQTLLSAAVMAMAIGTAGQVVALGEPLAQIVKNGVEDCRVSPKNVGMPFIAWGADAIAIEANGGTLKTSKGSHVAKTGWNITLELEDNFKTQLENYLACDSPFLRGTLGMLTAAAPVTNADARTEQVVIFKYSWSAGDGIVAGHGINRVKDLAGKRIAIQAYGPHLDFVARILDDADMSLDDVTIVWTKDLTGTSDSPADIIARGDADAAAMILPDARALTSNGTVGTGAEGSVKGATILFSTQEATAVIGDYISVRKDFFDANRDKIGALVNAFFRAEEETRDIMGGKDAPNKNRIGGMIADVMLGGLPAEEGVFLWQDAITDGWAGNAKHFGDPADPRRFAVLMDEVNKALKGADMIDRPVMLSTAGWDYANLTEGLTNLSERQIAAFDPQAAAAAVQRLRRTGQLDANTKIDFQVYFEPDTTSFPIDLYADDFEEIIRLAATYSGAIITVEGHADPLYYLKQEKAGVPDRELKAIRTSAMNLSMDRALSVVNALEGYAQGESISINRAQFTVDGIGITDPAFNPPKNAEEWRQNMRVKFRVLTTQAEATEFSPL